MASTRVALILITLAAVLAPSGGLSAQDERFQPPNVSFPAGAERAYRALVPRVEIVANYTALEIVRFMDQYWRLAGNPGYNATIDNLRDRLKTAGFADAPGKNNAPFVRVEDGPPTRGWDYQLGTVSFADNDEVVMSRVRDRVSLCINSFSTAEGGLVARLVDVGNGGNPADYEKVDVKGAVVLGDADAGRLWQQAVKARGAAGVISTAIAPYIRPSDPAKFTSPEHQDILQWSNIPYDAEAKSFGFKASWRSAARLRDRLKAGPVQVKVEIKSGFYDGPSRSLIAEIPGSAKPDERIVLVAHIQEPGANDNGSGSATLFAIAAALADLSRSRGVERGRTVTFMWLDEVRGSRQWLSAHADQAKGVQYMFSLDMTGEDVSKTGGTFLIEKQPDPSAVWTRPSDPHTQWGASDVKLDTLKGSLLNDVHLAIAMRRAKDTKWLVRTNPYEGGSDHTVFGTAGVPALLDWHFTDRYYHTNMDRPDKTSVFEIANVGVAVATSAWFLATADAKDAVSVADLLAASADARLALEQKQGAAIVAAAPDRAKAEDTERQIIAAWRKWYSEALESVRRLPVSGSNANVDARVTQAQQRLAPQ